MLPGLLADKVNHKYHTSTAPPTAGQCPYNAGNDAPLTLGAAPLRTLAPAPPVPKVYDATDIDTYSDIDDDPFTAGMMDIEEYSKLSESAPTILKRDRRDGEKRRSKSRSKLSRDTSDVNMDDGVKPEPMSPVKPSSSLADMFPPDERDGSRGSSRMDRDGRGERVRSFARTGGNEEVDEANRVDLSESESEEEVEGMEGDFVSSNGQVSRPIH